MADTLHAYRHVQDIYFPIAIAVFAIVIAVLLVLLVRGAGRSRPAAGRSQALALEIVFALLLTGVVGVLLWVTFTAETPLDRTAAHPALKVKVTAAQWSWRLQYPNGVTVTAISTWHPPVAIVPAGVEVEIVGTSRDVIHGFWIPQLHFQRQFLPGYVTRFDLRFDTPGLYGGECSVFCGDQHSQMHFQLRAVSPAAFQQWLSSNASRTGAAG
jgi:cytochrome c oxidase subunit 2